MSRRFTFLIVICTVLILAACGTGNDNNGDDSIINDEEDVIIEDDENEPEDDEEKTDIDESEEDQDDQSEDPSEKTDEADDQDLITETGIYNGQADPHTIEIETAEGPVAFQLSMDARDDIEDLTVDGKVKYSYYDNGEQLVIESIQPSE